MTDTERKERLASVLAQFTHPSFGSIARDLGDFEEALPDIASRAELVAPGRLYLQERLPIGMIVALALPTVGAEVYARHITAALVMGNLVLIAPLSEAQCSIADRLDRALPGRVRLANGDSPAPVDLRERLVVTLGPGTHRFDTGESIAEDDGPAARRALCEQYSTPVASMAVVRSSFLPAGAATTARATPLGAPRRARAATAVHLAA